MSNPDQTYPDNYTEEQKEAFDAGWTMASANLADIWEGYKAQSSGRTEAFESFDNFMSLVIMKIQGATNEDLAQVSELRGDFEQAEYLRS